MKIVDIFAGKLFAMHYDGEKLNEYERLMEYWSYSDKIICFLDENIADIPSGVNVFNALSFIREESGIIDEQLVDIVFDEKKRLDEFFAPLSVHEYQMVVLSLSKGKAKVRRPRYLRLYAIRIDTDLYLVTGGAIKLPEQCKMQERSHTQKELDKLHYIKDYLKDHGIFDNDSFCEFLNEQ